MPTPAAPVQLKGIAPVLEVRDLARAIAFYCTQLGFEVGFVNDDPPAYAILSADGLELHLRLTAEAKRGCSRVYLYVRDAPALREALRARGLHPAAPRLGADGMMEFDLKDPDGHLLCFATHVRPA